MSGGIPVRTLGGGDLTGHPPEQTQVPSSPSVLRQGVTQTETPSDHSCDNPIPSPLFCQQHLASIFTKTGHEIRPPGAPPPPTTIRPKDTKPLLASPLEQSTAFSFNPCPDAGWMVGVCEHGTTRWVRLACKRRTCPVCGDTRRRLIAWRIARGIDYLGGKEGAGWFVGTFSHDISKKAAVKVQGKFVQWLRRDMGIPVQYAATWEVTKSGRLHLNLVLAPWEYVPKKLLGAKWQAFGGGPVCWIKRVAAGVGVEAAKAQEGMGTYLAKWEQMVLNGKGATYSKLWPKLPSNPMAERQGKIYWRFHSDYHVEPRLFWYEVELGYWCQASPIEFRKVDPEPCSCFERIPVARSP